MQPPAGEQRFWHVVRARKLLRQQETAADATNMSTMLIPLVAAVLVLALVRLIDVLPALVPTTRDRGELPEQRRPSSDLPS